MLGLNPSNLGGKIMLACCCLVGLWAGIILYSINGIYGQAPALPLWLAVCYWLLWTVLSLWLVAAGAVAQRQKRGGLAFLAMMLGIFSLLVVLAYLQDLIKTRRR